MPKTELLFFPRKYILLQSSILVVGIPSLYGSWEYLRSCLTSLFFFHFSFISKSPWLYLQIYVEYDSLELRSLSSPMSKPSSCLTCFSSAPHRWRNPHSRQKDPMIKKPASKPCSGFFSHSLKVLVLRVVCLQDPVVSKHCPLGISCELRMKATWVAEHFSGS